MQVEVAGSGPGIPEDLRSLLFECAAFAGGTRGGGLGLMIVRRIVPLHGSEIRLVPRVGSGAVFAFALE